MDLRVQMLKTLSFFFNITAHLFFLIFQFLNSFWRDDMRLLEEDLLAAFAKAKSLFSANLLALPVVLDTGPLLVLPSKMAILALTKPL